MMFALDGTREQQTRVWQYISMFGRTSTWREAVQRMRITVIMRLEYSVEARSVVKPTVCEWLFEAMLFEVVL